MAVWLGISLGFAVELAVLVWGMNGVRLVEAVAVMDGVGVKEGVTGRKGAKS